MIKKSFILSVLVALSFNSFAQSSTVYFYRLKSTFMANTNCIIAVNDTAKFTLSNGSYYKMTTNAEFIEFITSVNNTGIKNLKLEKGKIYYIAAEMDINAVKLILKDEFTGKPAVERLEADKKVKETDSGNMKTVKVTTVAPIPVASEEFATIYLFRPFNVAGVNFFIKVSDGTVLYEMKNNSSYVISSVKEEITFTTMQEGSNTSNTMLKLKVEKGKVYYLAVLRSGGAIILTETKEEYAKKEMKLQ
jgi:hypothetical protein